MLTAYKFRLYPNKEQKTIIHKHIGACRFIYNWALNLKLQTYEQTGKAISRFQLNKTITTLKKEFSWLKEINSQSLQGATLNLERAFTNFFRKKASFPKFKSKKHPKQSFQIPQHYKLDWENNKVFLSKIGWVKAKLHGQFKGEMKTATVSKTPTGKYFISITVEDGKPIPNKQPFDEKTTMGIDLGITHFCILSNGEKIDNPKHLKKSLQRLKVLQKRLSRKQKGSNNREKARLKLAKLHEKIVNQRNDFQHKLSFKLIGENQAIALEDLNVKGMVKNHNLAQSILDVAWSSFVSKLSYKAEKFGKIIIKIGRFEPSSKICSVCGYYNDNLKLKDRVWKCPVCNTEHDRDVNAAVNIKKFALDRQNLIGL
jgi:putative transposase